MTDTTGSSDVDDSVCVIWCAGSDWWYHNRAHSDFQLLTRIAKKHRVLLVNSIGMRMPVPGRTSRPIYKIWRKFKSLLRLVRRPDPALPNLHVFSPLPIPFYHNKMAREFSAWFVRQQVRLAALWVGVRNPIIIVTPPTAWPVAVKMRNRLIAYNRSDKHSVFKEADQDYIRELEEDMLQHADLILYPNSGLMEEETAKTNGRARRLDHGVDLTLFCATHEDEPEDLASIPKPRIGFFGSLRSYMINFPLLRELAERIPDAQLVLIGDSQDSTKDLSELPNVHLLGFKDYKIIPQYGSKFDVALIPYQDNEWIHYCNPIKIKEYLALGLRIVSTDFPEAHRYAEHIDIARDDEDFIQKVKAALAQPITNGSRASLRDLVLTESWDHRTAELLEMFATVSSQRNGH